MVKPFPTKPLGLPPKVAAHLLGVSLPSCYRRIRDGSLTLLKIGGHEGLGGHKRVSIPALEAEIGRPLTLDEINAAVAAVAKAESQAMAVRLAP